MLKRSNPNCNGNRRDKVVLSTTCIKNVKFEIIKVRASCEYVEYFYYSENLNWAAQNLRLGCVLDVAGLSDSPGHFYGGDIGVFKVIKMKFLQVNASVLV